MYCLTRFCYLQIKKKKKCVMYINCISLAKFIKMNCIREYFKFKKGEDNDGF